MQRFWPYKITGTGILSRAGIGCEETRQNFFERKFQARPITPEQTFLNVEVRDEWFARFDMPKNTSNWNLMALVATQEALDQAGLKNLKGLRVGVSLGSTVGCSNHGVEFSRSFNSGEMPDPAPFYGHFKSNTSQFLARYFGCAGPVQMVSNACTSGADSIATAASWLEADLCDLVICGGTEGVLPQIYQGFRSLMLTSPTLCQPFDKNRQGLTLGEGAGILILEKSSSPRASKATLLGFGSSSDAFHPTAPHPEALGLDRAIKKTMKMARLPLEQIGFISAHGTGTSHNDLAEGKWVLRNLPRTEVVATKGYTGHTLAAAGAIEAVLTILSLQEQKLPVSLGFEDPDEEVGVSPTTEVVSGKYQTALSFSLGFGGTNSVLCLGRAT